MNENLPFIDESRLLRSLKELRGRPESFRAPLLADYPEAMQALDASTALEGYEKLVGFLQDRGSASRGMWASFELYVSRTEGIEHRLNAVAALAQEKFQLPTQPEARTIRRWSDQGLARAAAEISARGRLPNARMNMNRNAIWLEIGGQWPRVDVQVFVGRVEQFHNGFRINVEWLYQNAIVDSRQLSSGTAAPADEARQEGTSYLVRGYDYTFETNSNQVDELELRVGTAAPDAFRCVTVAPSFSQGRSVQVQTMGGICVAKVCPEGRDKRKARRR